MLPGKFRNVSSDILELEWYFLKINFVLIPMSDKVAATQNIYQMKLKTNILQKLQMNYKYTLLIPDPN